MHRPRVALSPILLFLATHQPGYVLTNGTLASAQHDPTEHWSTDPPAGRWQPMSTGECWEGTEELAQDGAHLARVLCWARSAELYTVPRLPPSHFQPNSVTVEARRGWAVLRCFEYATTAERNPAYVLQCCNANHGLWSLPSS